MLFVFLSLSCAVPVPPTGGPQDQTPPELIDQIPQDGSVAFAGRDLYFEFNEHVDRASFQRAFSIMPDVEGVPEFDWSGKSVRVQLPSGLRPGTTYIVTLDNGLRDARNVALTAPITLAFSTGNTIDQGELSGRVLDYSTGQAASGVDVYLYADNSDDRPLYRTQTGATGAFRLAYLAAGEYLVVAVRDLNRNRTIDPVEPFAVPPVFSLRVDSLPAQPPEPWVLASHDDTPPVPTGARAITRQDVEVRFSESVTPIPGPGLVLTDSLTGRRAQIRSVYAPPSSPGNLVLDTAPLTAGTWHLAGRPPAADSSGNMAMDADLTFDVPEGLAERVVEWVGFLPDSTTLDADSTALLWLGQQPGFALSRPVTVEEAGRMVSVRDTTGIERDAALRPDIGERVAATRFLIEADIEAGIPFDLTVQLPDSAHTRRFMVATDDMTGEISGVIQRPEGDVEFPIIVEVLPDGQIAAVTRVLSRDGRFLIPALPGGFRFRLRAFVDRNDDGSWTPGELHPWSAPEPILWYEGAEAVRARWETAIADTLRFVPLPGSRP